MSDTFELPALPYAHDALEPHIDARTMQIHHGKHHAAYTSKLNDAVQGTPMAGLSIEELLASHCDKAAVRNNGGGFYNHKLFWSVMAAPGNGGGGVIVGSVIDTAIKKNFGSFEKFKEAFAEAAATRFGSGWAWLCVHAGGKLEVCSTANQDNPLYATGRVFRDPDTGPRCLGARLLPQLPEQASRLHRRLLECSELG